MKYHLEQLQAAWEAGERAPFLFFWGHQPDPKGKITKSVFSQWWEAEFEAEGVKYASCEHYMMAGKARVFGDAEALAEILAAKTPAEAKKLGRKVRNFDTATWDAHKYGIVCAGNWWKFSQQRELGEFLLRTRPQVLVEASPFDAIWGIGLKGEDERAQNPQTWRGKNLLGFALMEVRDSLLEAWG